MFSEGCVWVQTSNKSILINDKGKTITDRFIPVATSNESHSYPTMFSEGLARVRLNPNGKSGFINKKGEIIIPLKYDWCSDFSDGLARVRIGEQIGYVDKKGKDFFLDKDYRFYWFSDFTKGEGLANISSNKHNKQGFIDKAGKEVIPLIYSGSFAEPSEGLIGVYTGKANTKYATKLGYIRNPVYFGIDLIEEYVKEKLNQWQEKGEFEKTVDYQKRVNPQSTSRKRVIYTQEAIDVYGKKLIDFSQKSIDKYDADKELFPIIFSSNYEISLPVPIKIAQEFKENFEIVQFQNPEYTLENDKLVIKYIEAIYQGKIYTYK